MDLQTVEAYLRPTDLAKVVDWQADWAWREDRNWMFSQPQLQVKILAAIFF